MNFGEATSELRAGKRIQRTSWNCEGLFVFMQIPSTISKEIVPRMQSLPQSVKDEFERRFNDTEAQIDSIYYSDQLALVNSSNIITSYSPSCADTLAIDWIVLD